MKQPRQKKILLTGGGTAGHVFPHCTLFSYFKKNNINIHYIGSYKGIERSIIQKENIPYTGICTGKLRRYFSFKNLFDFFFFFLGIIQSLFYLLLIRPNLTFSKGGFVSVPVVIASFILRIPIVIHESDLTMGLANRICSLLAHQICFTFTESLATIPKKKRHKFKVVGALIREEIFQGKKEYGLHYCHWNNNARYKTLLIMGGSLGSQNINQIIYSLLPTLQKEGWRIIHLCGKGKQQKVSIEAKYYCSFEFVNQELKHLLALADIVISRAGSGSIFEILALQKPNLLIPLSRKASRGDQLLNAQIFYKKGYSRVLEEEDLCKTNIMAEITLLWNQKKSYQTTMQQEKIAGKNLLSSILHNFIK